MCHQAPLLLLLPRIQAPLGPQVSTAADRILLAATDLASIACQQPGHLAACSAAADCCCSEDLQVLLLRALLAELLLLLPWEEAGAARGLPLAEDHTQ